jgi:hypothetical protein
MRRTRCAFTRASILLACVVLMCQGRAISAEDGSMTLEQLIELVRQNELLYSDIDVTIRDEYETGSMPDAPVTGTAHVGRLKVIQKEVCRHRYVVQGDWYHRERAGILEFGREDKQEVIQFEQYDGDSTRSRSGRLARLVHGRAECGEPIRAHALFQRMVGIVEPLSIFLRGDTWQGTPPPPDAQTLWFSEYKGELDYNGEPCYQVELTRRVRSAKAADASVLARCLIWLSKRRNLIPVAYVGYEHDAPDLAPHGEAVVKSWLEVQPGLWFPQKLEFRALDRDVLRTSGRKVLAWRRIYTVESVSLNPEHPRSFFQSVTFPQGTLVYEYNGSTRIRGYRVGTPEDPNLATRNHQGVNRRLLWMLGIAALAGAIATVVYLRYRRKERT